MRRFPLFLLLLAIALAPATAHAAKFQKGIATVTDGNIRTTEPPPTLYHGGLLVEFREIGVPGSQPTTSYLVTADASATYACINNGDNYPKASNKQGVTGPVSATATFNTGTNGAVEGGIGVPPLLAGSLSCPPGQSLILADVSYTNVVIKDTTNGVSFSIPGTFSLTLVPLK